MYKQCFKAIKLELVKLFIVMTLLFVIAERTSYWQAYGYLFVSLISFVMVAIMSIKNKDFAKLLSGDGISSQYKFKKDGLFWRLYWPIYLGLFIVAGLDTGRYGWSQISHVIYPLAYIVYIVSYAFTLWAMWTNKYFYGTMHTQINHQLIQKGPYKIIRHPGYLGAVFLLISSAIILGSLWALIPAGFGAILLIIRTTSEETILHDHLEGYSDYTQRIKFRLLPGIW